MEMRKNTNTPAGTVHRLALDSEALAGNLLGDPTLRGIDVYRLNTYGLELFLGKGFGPATPYASYGRQRSDARGTAGTIELHDRSTIARYGAGVQLNLVVVRVAVEATQAEARSYAARVTFGF